MKKITYSFKKDIAARKEQQDNVSITKKANDVLIALGDGMGGHTDGAVASSIFVTKAEKLFLDNNQNNIPELFQKIIVETENQISDFANEKGKDPHTTATLALITEQGVNFANIGDSRIYIFDQEKLLLRSRDHSVPEMLLQMGEITEDEMATHPDQNKLTKSVGPTVHEKLSHYSFQFEDNKDYIILACSDGFWEYVKEKEMIHFLFHNEVETALSNMLEIARERGGDKGDNISVAAVSITKDNESKKEEKINPKLSKKSNHNKTIFFVLLTFFIAVSGGYFYLKTSQITKVNQDDYKNKK